MTTLTSLCNIDTLSVILKNIAFAFSVSCLATFGGMLFLAFFALKKFQQKRLSAYAKGARQMALMALLFGWSLLIAIRVWLYYFPHPNFEYYWLAMSGAVLLQSVHYAFWKKLAKAHIFVHKCLLLFNALLALSITTLVIFALRLQIHLLFQDSISAWGVLQHFSSTELAGDCQLHLYIVSCCLSILISLSFPAVWGAFCLPFFKKYQDFGRDHYRTLVVWCSFWARNSWTILWIVQCCLVLTTQWYLWQNDPDINRVIAPAMWQIVWLIPILLWSRIYKSKQPLRHKITLFLALLCSISLF